jgi:hypothetical protein
MNLAAKHQKIEQPAKQSRKRAKLAELPRLRIDETPVAKGPVAAAIEKAQAASNAWRSNGVQLLSSVTPAQFLIQHFKDEHRIPNAVLRSAVFAARNVTTERLSFECVRAFAVGSLEVVLIGRQLDQSDMDVLLALHDHAQSYGTVFVVSRYALLKTLGKPNCSRSYEWLKLSLYRLGCAGIAVHSCGGMSMQSFITWKMPHDAPKGTPAHVEVTLHRDWYQLFGLDGEDWSRVSRSERQALRRNTTAKALHAYYSSHAKPGVHTYETLGALCGLRITAKKHLRQELIRAHEALKRIKFIRYTEADGGIVVERVTMTKSQRKRAHADSAR